MSEPHTYASARDAGTSSGSHVASTTTSTAPGGSSSRRKTPKPAVSLGLEDEVEFGSDEDLMEVVGEIPMPAHEAWYPGRPDPPPKEKPKKKGLGLSTNNTAGVKSRSGLFGKDKEKGKVKGLDDARLMSTDEMAGRLSAVDLHAAPSLPSLVGGGARRARESSEYSGKSSLKTSSSALGAQGSRRQKVLGKLFGGAGAKKGSKEEGPNVQGRMGTESVESFGSISRFSEASSNTRSILITAAHVPPNHTPSSRVSTDPPSSLSSVPHTPYSVNHGQVNGRRTGSTSTSTHKQIPSSSSADAPLIRRPSASMSTSDSTPSSESHGPSSPAKIVNHAAQIPYAGFDVESMAPSARSKSVERRHGSIVSGTSGHSAESSGGCDPGSSMFHALLPNFPSTEIAIEGITILTATVFRRTPGSNGPSDKRFRPGTANSTISTFGALKKPVWQSHQLVLTAFRINDSTPRPTPNLNEGGRQRQPSETRTVAHLHLFGQPHQKPSSRPTSVSVGIARKPTSVVEGIPRIELERQKITAGTTAGVWEHDDAEAGAAVGRKWVLRVGFEGEPEEWLCDMPTGDTLFEWVRQIKAHATILRAEGMGHGRAIRQAHMNGHDDLNLELELHEQGLKATPRAMGTVNFADTSVPPELYGGEYGQAPGYQPEMLSPDRVVIPDSPHGVSMRDFMTRKSLSPRGQDLATFLDNADMDWQIRQAEKNRMERQARSDAGSVSGDVAAPGPVNRSVSVNSPARSRTPKPDERDVLHRSSTKAGMTVPPPPTAPPPACQLPVLPPATIVPPVPPLPPLLPAPIAALPATPSSGGGTPITPAQASAETMQPLPAVTLASPARSPSGQGHLTPEAAARSYFPADDISVVEPTEARDATAEMEARMRKLTSDDGRLAAGGPSAPPSSYAGSVMDDGASVRSGTSSQQRMKRRTQKQPALDLMAELSSRPEMNFPQPGALGEDAKVVVDENRPRKIRFG